MYIKYIFLTSLTILMLSCSTGSTGSTGSTTGGRIFVPPKATNVLPIPTAFKIYMQPIDDVILGSDILTFTVLTKPFTSIVFPGETIKDMQIFVKAGSDINFQIYPLPVKYINAYPPDFRPLLRGDSPQVKLFEFKEYEYENIIKLYLNEGVEYFYFKEINESEKIYWIQGFDPTTGLDTNKAILFVHYDNSSNLSGNQEMASIENTLPFFARTYGSASDGGIKYTLMVGFETITSAAINKKSYIIKLN